MQTIEGLKRKIQSTEDLRSIVKTMKALAAVNIRQYEKAVASIETYNRTIEMGLQIVLRNRPEILSGIKPTPKNRLGVLIFGSDQGMCGQLNEQVISHAVNTMNDLGVKNENRTILVVGERAKMLLEDRKQPIEAYFSVPGSVAGIAPTVQELLIEIERWIEKIRLDHVFLFYSKQLSGSAYTPHEVHLLPKDQDWMRNLQQSPWPTRAFPTYTMDLAPCFHH